MRPRWGLANRASPTHERPSRAACQRAGAPMPAAETAPMPVTTIRRASAIQLFFFADIRSDGVDQIADVPRLVEWAIHWNIDVELVLDGRQNHHDVDRFKIKAFDRRIQGGFLT